jgi:hypothetical protein
VGNNVVVKCVADKAGDLPKSLIGKKGLLTSRNKLHDESGVKAYNVLISGKRFVLWEDEFILIQGGSNVRV